MISAVIIICHVLVYCFGSFQLQDMFLRTFALIVSAHPYCARKFTCHVIHERAR